MANFIFSCYEFTIWEYNICHIIQPNRLILNKCLENLNIYSKKINTSFEQQGPDYTIFESISVINSKFSCIAGNVTKNISL